MRSHFRSLGFTLVEILVTIALVGVMIVVYNVVITNSIIATGTKDKDLALKIANSKIEELRSLGYANLPVSGSFSDPLLSSLTNGTGAVAVSTYSATLKQVSVTVSFYQTNATTSVALSTLIAHNGGI